MADWRPDSLTVHISTQFTTGVRRELANAFDLPLDKVRVVVDGMGGGFGSNRRSAPTAASPSRSRGKRNSPALIKLAHYPKDTRLATGFARP